MPYFNRLWFTPHTPSAIELAEGALLADIAVLFQLLFVYLPIGGVFALLIPTVFAMLVLRRGLYVGILSLCVAIFVACILTGLGALFAMLLPGGAGLFLGITMKHRLRHGPLVLLGVLGSTVTLYALFLLSALLTGLGTRGLVLQMRGSARASASTLAWLSSLVGLGGWWQQHAYPTIAPVVATLLNYWWIALLGACYGLSCPLVVLVYVITNRFVRLLGYTVRPFPDGRVAALIARVRQPIIGLARRWMLRRGVQQ